MEIITYKHHSLLKKKGVKKFIKIKKKKIWHRLSLFYRYFFDGNLNKIIFFFKRWKYENKKDYDLVTDIFLFKFYSFDI